MNKQENDRLGCTIGAILCTLVVGTGLLFFSGLAAIFAGSTVHITHSLALHCFIIAVVLLVAGSVWLWHALRYE